MPSSPSHRRTFGPLNADRRRHGNPRSRGPFRSKGATVAAPAPTGGTCADQVALRRNFPAELTEALKAVRQDRELTRWFVLARADQTQVMTSSATLVEVIHPRINHAALQWQLSRLKVEPVTEHVAREAAQLLRDAGLHGHRHAIDAMPCAIALAKPGPVTILTSEPDDLRTLCEDRATIIKI